MGETYVFTIDAVRRAIDRLAITPAHENFGGYLALLEAERESKAALHRSKAIWDFHRRYLAVSGLKPNYPWFSPVRPPQGGIPKLIYKNIAGSYGDSIKPANPFSDAVDVKGKGQGITYTLRPGHANVIFERMLDGKRIQAIALASYLFRDFGLELDDPDLQLALDVFRDRFALRSDHADEAETFDTLFDPSLDGFSNDDLVPVPEDAA